MDYKQALAQEIAAHTTQETAEIHSLLETPPSQELGDYALPCFALAKHEKKAPAIIAQQLAQEVQAPFIERVEDKGPYLNIYLDRAEVTKTTLAQDTQPEAQKHKILFEFPSPNTNKPLHLGHLRNMLLGESSARICEHAGNTVIRTNLNNDRGVHICKSMLAYQKFGDDITPQDMNLKPDHFVGHWYVKFCEEAKNNPELEKEAQEMLVKWEQQDPQVRALWKKLNDYAHQGFKETYQRLGITFDKEYFEHKFYDQAKKTVTTAYEEGVFAKDEKGNIVAKLPEELGDKVVLRADNTAVYATQDVELARLKQEEFAPDTEIYVVGEEQSHYFKQLFAILTQLGMTHERHHLSYGLIELPSGRMKSREGNVVDCDDLLDEVEALARKEVTNRHDSLAEEEIARRAKIIAHAALRFYMLKYEPKTGFTYDPEESVSFEGETGPYIQYAAARITSILNEAQLPTETDYSAISAEEEYALIRLLYNTPEVVAQASQQYKAHLVARHALAIAQAFTKFYHECRILDAPKEQKEIRLHIIQKTHEHLKELMNLLGIELLEQM